MKISKKTRTEAILLLEICASNDDILATELTYDIVRLSDEMVLT